MGETDETEWFVELSSGMRGPISREELGRLVRERAVSGMTPVSKDRSLWQPAWQVRELEPIFLERSLVPAPPPIVTPEREPESLPSEGSMWIGGGIFAGVILLLSFVACSGLIWSRKPTAGTVALSNQSVAEAVNPFAKPTLGYWLALKAEFASAPANKNDVGVHVERVADRIARLPVLHVDSAVVDLATDYVRLLRQFATAHRRQSDPKAFVEAFYRGLSGDIFGPGLDALQENKAFAQQYEELRHRTTQMRAALSQHYGIEFPSL